MEKKKTVLVLDDEVNILHALKRVFMDEHFDLHTTMDSQEARGLIEQGGIKVILCDQRMPKTSGVEFLKEIKKNQPDIIRILFTGYADVEVAEEAINQGEVYRFINKPWNDEDLRVTVRQAIEKFDLIQEKRMLDRQIQEQNTQLVELNAKLRHMYNLQKSFTSTVSHELRTPLASIKTALEVVLDDSGGQLSKEQKEFLLKAQTNIDRLNRLINDVLDLSRLESGRITFNIQKNDLNKIIAEIVELQRPVAEKKRLSLKAQLDPGLPPFSFDADKITQVVNNLINNAIRFTAQGGITIASRTNLNENHVIVQIQDTGDGIKKEDMPRLFKKFQQLDSPLKSTGGTGLGLAICKEILTQMGGKIWVESQGQEGQGSTFNFILPLQERREQNKGET